ncbi:MAG: aldehyde dehydrogenase [Clostridiales Family XIII bacterium]|jgi:lactaldehyde dehydrogenase/glycolaldehyde dehydrogenase|nr:aldehyde dehydrogenase [Clostridiales Family XIII bacterium]
MTKFQNYINGKLQDAADNSWIDVLNPVTGEVVYQVPNSGPKEIDAAIEAAATAQKSWAKVNINERGAYIKRLAAKIVEKSEKIGVVLATENGKPLSQAVGEINGVAGLVEYHSAWDRRMEGEIHPGDNNNKENILLLKEPIGVVASITPWNAPIYVFFRKVAPALMAGCTLICKPSSDTPASTLMLAELFEELEFPKGVVNIVSGRGSVFGEAVANDPRVNMITMTGSGETGKSILRKSAENLCKVSLELGGKAPAIVMEDADLDLAADCISAGRIANAGQICNCTERLYVQESIAETFIEKLKIRMEAAEFGDGMKNPDIAMGSLINKEAQQRVHGMVERAVAQGAKLILGGALPDGPGAFYPATLLTNVKQDQEIVQEEVFGPVLPILTFKNPAEALALANDCKYGLTSALYTSNYNTVMLFANNIEFGELYVNRVQGEAYQGFHAGWKLSGIGGDDGKHGFEEFLQTRNVYLDYQTDLY